jgi:hypothetical protein
MNKDNIQSGEDYAKVLIDIIVEGELDLSQEQRMDSKMLQYWTEEIDRYAKETWHKYIIGARESYLFDEDEMHKLYENAGLKYASDILNGLVDKEMIEVGVKEDGELVYSLTEKGKNYVIGGDD